MTSTSIKELTSKQLEFNTYNRFLKHFVYLIEGHNGDPSKSDKKYWCRNCYKYSYDKKDFDFNDCGVSKV